MARTSRRTLAAGCAAVISAALAFVPSVASGGSGGFQDYTVISPLAFTVQVGPTNATTCVVDADLYVPRSASPTNRVPAILASNGFGGSKADQAGLGKAFAARGYAFLSYTGLGFPNSAVRSSSPSPRSMLGWTPSSRSSPGTTCSIRWRRTTPRSPAV